MAEEMFHKHGNLKINASSSKRTQVDQVLSRCHLSRGVYPCCRRDPTGTTMLAQKNSIAEKHLYFRIVAAKIQSPNAI